MRFESDSRTVYGLFPSQSFSLTSDEAHPLEDVIKKADFSTDWYVILNGLVGYPASNTIDLATTSNSMYITYGPPRFSGSPNNEPTLKRMDRAMDYAATDNPDAKDELISRIVGRCGAFNLNQPVPVNAWTLPDIGSGQCISIVRFVQNVLYMVGFSGDNDGSSGYVVLVQIYAKSAAPTTAIVVPNGHGGLATDGETNADGNKLYLADGNRSANNYEACLKVTLDGTIRYYPGGVSFSTGFTDPDVLLQQAFCGLGWFRSVAGHFVLVSYAGRYNTAIGCNPSP